MRHPRWDPARARLGTAADKKASTPPEFDIHHLRRGPLARGRAAPAWPCHARRSGPHPRASSGARQVRAALQPGRCRLGL